jgi:hypothetical protein
VFGLPTGTDGAQRVGIVLNPEYQLDRLFGRQERSDFGHAIIKDLGLGIAQGLELVQQ